MGRNGSLRTMLRYRGSSPGLRADLEFERQRGERLMGLLEAAQRQLTDQRPIQLSWWARLFGRIIKGRNHPLIWLNSGSFGREEL